MVRAPGVLNEAYDYFPKPSSFSRGLCFDINGFKILLISCTASVDENGKTIHVGDFRAQCWRTYRNITEILEAEKMTWYDIVRTTCYLRDIERDYNDFNEEVGLCNKPVLLKRGMSATIKEFLFAAAEYILKQGNQQVILCERGIRTFETATRNTLDLNAVPVLKKLSHLPVIVDPSHGTGHWWMVPSMAKAAVAAGADGLLVEVHCKPEEALSDGPQCLRPDKFNLMMQEIKEIAHAVGRNKLIPKSSLEQSNPSE